MARPDKATLDRLAPIVPDIPWLVETRPMVLPGCCEVFGLEEGEDTAGDRGLTVRDTADQPISVVKRPVKDLMEEAVARECDEDVGIAQLEMVPTSPQRCQGGSSGGRFCACSVTRHGFPRFRRVRYACASYWRRSP